MSTKTIGSQSKFTGGIAISKKEGIANSFAFGVNIDHRSDPRSVRINPKSENVSNNTIKDLILWGQRACDRLYFYDRSGNLYKRESDTTSLVHTANNSSGNGLVYFGEEDALYYAQDKSLGRLSNPCTGSNFIDDYLASEGGEPTNEASLILEADSNQYLSKTDTSSLSLTGDLSFEAYIKPESLPSDDEEQVFLSKWNENGNKRSYKFGLGTADDFFGDGSDGDITISSNTEWDPIDSACSGTAGTKTLSATNSSFAAGQQILIIQNRGNIAGYYELNEIKSYTTGTITTVKPLQLTYSSGDYLQSGNGVKTQVIVIPQYNNVTVNSGATWSCKDWNGTTGGVMVWKAKGTVTINGTINASHKGFRGGWNNYIEKGTIVGCDCFDNNYCVGSGQSGEDAAGKIRPTTYDCSTSYECFGGFHFRLTSQGNSYPFCHYSELIPSFNGGGWGGQGSRDKDSAGGGGGGSYGTSGTKAADALEGAVPAKGGNAGDRYGDSLLKRVHLGAGGGGGGHSRFVSDSNPNRGGSGGGALMLFGNNFTGSGAITSDGQDGGESRDEQRGAGGGGAGGSVLLKMNTGNFSNISVTYNGGDGGAGRPGEETQFPPGGDGGRGRSHVDYGTSFNGGGWGETSTKDSSLAQADNIILFLDISDNGTDTERYSIDISDQIETDVWRRWGVVWDASASRARFYKNGISLGTRTGSMTSIDDNNSDFLVGASLDSSGNPENFYDGLIDDVRVWSDRRTTSELTNWNDRVLNGEENNLVAYYEFDNTFEDSQSDANNNLSANSSGGSVDLIVQEDDTSKILQEDSIGAITQETDAQLDFSNDIPFYGITNRNDLDISNDVTGSTYTILTIINEEDDQKIEFTPTKDPQKSIILDIDTVGTGDWTITVHDATNNTVAELTVDNAELYTGLYEFTFDDVWRPTLGRTYHIHVTSTVSDGSLVTSAPDDLSTARFFMYYQFLIDDIYHPMEQMLNFVVIGNERYVGKLEGGGIFEPNYITLPSSYRVRCFAKWREYLAIGVTRGDEITDYDEGYIFFWDGISDTYNFFIKVPEGGINSMYATKDTLYVIAGYQGTILAYTGGQGAQIVHRIPNLELDETIEIAPGAMTMWRTKIIMGVGLDTDSETVYKGAYTFGRLTTQYPFSLGFEYNTSLGTQSTSDVTVGMVHPFGSDLYMSWGTIGNYGLDKISITNDCYEDASLELLLTDSGMIHDDKKVALVIRAEFEPLKDGQSVTLKYKKNRASSWTTLTKQDSLNQTNARETLRGRLKEMQFGIDMESENGDPIILTGMTLELAADRGRHV